SIIIREKEETSGAELLYKNALVDQYRNYLNEPYIIRSNQLIHRVIKDLDFNISFYRQGYVLTTEVYNALPVKARFIRKTKPNDGIYTFKLLNDSIYRLEFQEA